MRAIVLMIFWGFQLLNAQVPEGMVYVPEGTYIPSNNKDTVQHINEFYIDETEVTVKEFETFVLSTGYETFAEKGGYSIIVGGHKKGGVDWRCDEKGNLRDSTTYEEYPVIHIAWSDAFEYANWAGKRLPTEAEWEYAFRESKSANYTFCGSNNWRKVAWNSDNPNVTKIMPVGKKMPNSLGVYDMSGNVAEMCYDLFDPTGKKRPAFVKVAKGGSYVDNVKILNFKGRMPCGEIANFLFGFRCVKEIKNKK